MNLQRLRMLPLTRVLAVVCAASLVTLIGGCGYQQSGSMANAPQGYQWASLYRGDVKTVAVPIFANRSYYRGVEFQLTEAISKQLEAHTPYKIVSRAKADTVLEGEIIRVRVRTVSDDRISQVPQEQLYSVRVNFTWKDLRTGRILAEEKDFEQAAPYYPTLGEGQFVGEQQNVERLALAIVQRLEAAW